PMAGAKHQAASNPRQMNFLVVFIVPPSNTLRTLGERPDLSVWIRARKRPEDPPLLGDGGSNILEGTRPSRAYTF
ncbi:MAG TPA: hypothetical protein VMH26_09045, partial [Burkholderiales bacterium]|nr:hypothetical protein [Burkholderiales bacterium]